LPIIDELLSLITTISFERPNQYFFYLQIFPFPQIKKFTELIKNSIIAQHYLKFDWYLWFQLRMDLFPTISCYHGT